jgi:hypothetical protein
VAVKRIKLGKRADDAGWISEGTLHVTMFIPICQLFTVVNTFECEEFEEASGWEIPDLRT